MLNTYRNWHGDERGSLPLAMLAVIVVAALASVAVATAIAGQRHTGFDQRFEQSLQVAETGVDRLAHLVRTGDINAFLAANPAGIAETTLPSGAVYWTEAPTVVEGTWTLTGHGRVGDVTRTVVLELPGQQLFPYGILTDEGTHMPGAARLVASYHSDDEDWWTGEGITASNGGVHAPSAQVDGIEANLSPPIDIASPEAVNFIAETCEDATLVDLTLSGSTASLTAEDSPYCVGDLHFAANSTTTVDGPVELYVMGSTTFGADATINCSDGCVAGTDFPAPGDLRIYTASESQIKFSKQLTMAAAIYAPRAHCQGGPHARIFGALTCRRAGQFPGHFRLYYDQALGDVSRYLHGRWSEEPQ